MSIKPVIISKLRGKNFGGNNVVADSFDSTDHTILNMENQESLFTSTTTTHPTNQGTYKIFVSSWNVGGIRPPADIGMEAWLNLENCPADIYVFGFQEIVPLSPGNVLKYENSKVCVGWNSILGAALNNNNNNNNKLQKGLVGGKHSSQEFKCIISKQMVGLFLSVWARTDLCPYIKHFQVSCVGCGIMGCLGNKGSVSVRFFLRETSFCFVCSHLASGGREGDEKHRNEDALDILSRTTFSHGSSRNIPTKILDHDRVVWLGDLNYRIHLPDSMTRSLVEKRKWNILLEKDELKAELMEGRVFQGWQEGLIKFAPTYKYYPNSEVYYGSGDSSCHQKRKNEKIRAPAWCDRIIWFGEGLKQSKYERGESKLSDHRPVRAIFTAEVEVFRSSAEISSLLSERIDCLTSQLKSA